MRRILKALIFYTYIIYINPHSLTHTYVDTSVLVKPIVIKKKKIPAILDVFLLVRFRNSYEIGMTLQRVLFCHENALSKFQTVSDCPIFINTSHYIDMPQGDVADAPTGFSVHPYVSITITYPV